MENTLSNLPPVVQQTVESVKPLIAKAKTALKLVSITEKDTLGATNFDESKGFFRDYQIVLSIIDQGRKENMTNAALLEAFRQGSGTFLEQTLQSEKPLTDRQVKIIEAVKAKQSNNETSFDQEFQYFAFVQENLDLYEQMRKSFQVSTNQDLFEILNYMKENYPFMLVYPKDLKNLEQAEVLESLQVATIIRYQNKDLPEAEIQEKIFEAEIQRQAIKRLDSCTIS